eukprot:3931965-Rhodomonas_salina.1
MKQIVLVLSARYSITSAWRTGCSRSVGGCSFAAGGCFSFAGAGAGSTGLGGAACFAASSRAFCLFAAGGLLFSTCVMVELWRPSRLPCAVAGTSMPPSFLVINMSDANITEHPMIRITPIKGVHRLNPPPQLLLAAFRCCIANSVESSLSLERPKVGNPFVLENLYQDVSLHRYFSYGQCGAHPSSYHIHSSNGGVAMRLAADMVRKKLPFPPSLKNLYANFNNIPRFVTSLSPSVPFPVWTRRLGKFSRVVEHKETFSVPAVGSRASQEARMSSVEEELATAQAAIAKKDADLAKAKRMMVALNNKFKAKFAALEAKKAAEAPAGEGGGNTAELEEKHAAELKAKADELATLQSKLQAEAERADALKEELLATQASEGSMRVELSRQEEEFAALKQA